MSSPLAPLPDMPALAVEYQRGSSYAVLGAKYGCTASTVRNRLKAWADENGVEWPLRHVKKNWTNPNIVSAKLVREDIAKTCRQFRISQIQLAKVAKVTPNLLHKISSGYKETIYRSTQGKILEACSKLYAGEVVLEPTKQLLLPMHVRDICANGHRWNGQRWPSGVRKCNICVAAKHARADEARRKKAS